MLFPLLVFLGAVSAADDYSRQEAQKVIGLIGRILEEQSEAAAGGMRKVVLTESELNSYIAYRVEEEHSEIMRELRLKIFPGRRLEGKIYIDLRGQDLPKILKPEMNFYFDGTLEIRDNLFRLNLSSLYLENQKILPELLNTVIYLGSKIQGSEPFRLDDWFELPYGIKNVETELGRAVFHY